MMVDTSDKTVGDIGKMYTMRFRTKSEVQCLQFSYYLDREVGSQAAFSYANITYRVMIIREQ